MRIKDPARPTMTDVARAHYTLVRYCESLFKHMTNRQVSVHLWENQELMSNARITSDVMTTRYSGLSIKLLYRVSEILLDADRLFSLESALVSTWQPSQYIPIYRATATQYQRWVVNSVVATEQWLAARAAVQGLIADGMAFTLAEYVGHNHSWVKPNSTDQRNALHALLGYTTLQYCPTGFGGEITEEPL